MEVTYRRNLYKSYMCIKEQAKAAEEYELHMLEGRNIPYLLGMKTVLSNGERQYWYDISGKQQLEDYLSGKKMDYGILWNVLNSIRELCVVLPEYLLREGGVCLEPEYIYVDLEDGKLSFAYLPFEDRSLPETFERYMEQLLRKIDHQDRMATELGYQVYQMCTMENANIQGIFEGILKKEGRPMPDCGLGQGEKIKTEPKERRGDEPEIESIRESPPKKKIWENFFGKYEVLEGKVPWLGGFRDCLRRGTQEKSCPEIVTVEKFQKESSFEKHLPSIFRKKANSIEDSAKFSGESRSKGTYSKETAGKAYGRSQNPKKSFCLGAGLKACGQSQNNKADQKEHIITEKPSQKGIYDNFLPNGPEPAHPTEILGARIQEPDGKLVYQGDHGCEDILVSGDAFLLGKNKQQAAGMIEAEGISRLHAKISWQDGDYYLEDLNSTNGTYLNGNPVEYHQKKKLHKGDKIRFGAEEFLFS